MEQTKAKHTPGPWVANDVDYRKATGTHNISTEEGSTVAQAYGSNREQLDANARLIAAAPELLDALKETRDVSIWLLGQTETPLPAEWVGYGARINRAIAKAEGK